MPDDPILTAIARLEGRQEGIEVGQEQLLAQLNTKLDDILDKSVQSGRTPMLFGGMSLAALYDDRITGGLRLLPTPIPRITRMDRCSRRGSGAVVNRGDIYLVTLDPTAGREQQGHHPVLVVSPAAFNAATRLPVVLPITNGGAFARRIGFAVPVSGIKTTGVVRCDQPRVLDLQERNGRKVDTLPATIMADVLARLAAIFE